MPDCCPYPSPATLPVKALLASMPPEVRGRVTTFGEYADRPPIRWLVPNLIPLEGLVVLSAQPGTGKSVLALKVALRLAAGAPILGQTAAGRTTVLYVLLEGQPGFSGRIRAAAEFEGTDLESVPACVYTPRLRLLDPASVAQLVETIKSLAVLGNHVLVIVDTLAQAIGGDGNENDATCMQKVVESCQFIQSEGQATVMLVAHGTKSGSSTIRGHGSLRGSVDAVLLLEKRPDDGAVILSLDKAKESDGEQTLAYELFGYTIGQDDFGAPITAPVMQQIDGLREQERPRIDLHPNHHAIVSVVQASGPAGISRDELLRSVKDRGLIAGEKVARAVDNAASWLTSRGLLVLDQGHFKLAV